MSFSRSDGLAEKKFLSMKQRFVDIQKNLEFLKNDYNQRKWFDQLMELFTVQITLLEHSYDITDKLKEQIKVLKMISPNDGMADMLEDTISTLETMYAILVRSLTPISKLFDPIKEQFWRGLEGLKTALRPDLTKAMRSVLDSISKNVTFWQKVDLVFNRFECLNENFKNIVSNASLIIEAAKLGDGASEDEKKAKFKTADAAFNEIDILQEEFNQFSYDIMYAAGEILTEQIRFDPIMIYILDESTESRFNPTMIVNEDEYSALKAEYENLATKKSKLFENSKDQQQFFTLFNSIWKNNDLRMRKMMEVRAPLFDVRKSFLELKPLIESRRKTVPKSSTYHDTQLNLDGIISISDVAAIVPGLTARKLVSILREINRPLSQTELDKSKAPLASAIQLEKEYNDRILSTLGNVKGSILEFTSKIRDIQDGGDNIVIARKYEELLKAYENTRNHLSECSKLWAKILPPQQALFEYLSSVFSKDRKPKPTSTSAPIKTEF